MAAVAAMLLGAASLIWVGAGPAVADVVTGTNTTPIAVPAAGSPSQIGPGSPYPSPITINGMTGTVTDVNVTLTSVNHGIAQDMDVLLVGPAGQNLLLMSDAAGGATGASGFGVNGTLTFDDAAAGPIPASPSPPPLGTGTFRPTNNAFGGPDVFPAPAPAPSTATALSVFNGTIPNGVWNLYTVDDSSGDLGSIGGGWSITVTTDVVVQPGVIQFTTSAFRGAEGGGPVSLTLERVAGDDGAVSVTVTTTTPATATAGVDFAALNQTVTFADGQTTASVPLTILNDTAVEGIDETVTVALSAPTGGATLGTPSTAVVRIDDNDATSDATPIAIPGTGSGNNTGAPANPYPASIHVSSPRTVIGGVEVTLTGFSHAIPEDVDILLVGPGGQNVVLMSDVGGGLNPVSNINLRFSDSGSGTIPVVGPIVSGTYRPSDNDPGGAVDNFPAPAPTPSTATSLAAFVATNPNGVWNLFIVDDASGDTGSISGGWSLNFLPFADAGGPYTVGEGQPLTLDGTGTDAPAGSTFAWDVDNDGQFDDATGLNPTVSAATLATLGLGDGPAGPVTVTLQVTSGTTVRTDTATLTITNTPPTASVVTVPTGIIEDTAATFTFGATDPSAADTAAGFTYAINWGDGSAVQSVTGGATVNVSHTFATAGTFTVSVIATDKDGGTSAAATASVGVEAAVVADAGGPYTIGEGLPVTLDGSATVAPDTATFEWDVDADGQFDDATGETPTISAATLATLGLGDGPDSVTVGLRVTSGSQVSTDTAALTITNTAPIAAVVTVPTAIVEGTSASFTFGATDPAAADTAAGFTYAIDWGDGSAVQTVTGGTTVDVTHTYAADGTFTLSVTATDKDNGTSAAATASVTVEMLVVADAGGPYTVGEGLPVTLDGSGTAAPDTATFDWDVDGDGQFDDATGESPTIPAAALATLGLGDGPDSGEVGLQVTSGSQVSTDTATLTITNMAPTASIDGVPPLIVVGVTAPFTFGATDPSAADTAAGFAYTVNWGDGSTTAQAGGTALAVGHTYATAGTFTISVTVTDKDGGAGSASVAVVAVDEVIADAGGPYTVGEGEPLTLDGSGSAAPGDATFNWDLQRDGIIDATGRTPTITAAYLQSISLGDGPPPGGNPIEVALQVLSGGQTSVHSTDLTITNTAPTASITAASGVVAGTSATFTFGATDPSLADTATGFTYVINWGDGTGDQTVPNGAATLPVDHTYAEAGQFTISVTATDKDGGESAEETALVLVAPDVNAGGPYTAGEGQPVTLDGSGTIAAPNAEFAWDVDGDGEFDDATSESPTISAQTLADLGLGDGLVPPVDVTVGLQVTAGPAVATATTTLTITNTPPTAAVTNVPAGLMATSPATFTFGATDPSAADTAAGFSYAIDWGDLSAVQTVTGDASVDVEHTYAAVGAFTISVTATDKDGGVSPAATRVASVGPLVVADAGGGTQRRYAITEGEDLALDGTGTTAGPTAVYEWDLDDDGDFSDATGPAPVLTPEELAVFGLDDGPQGPLPITLRVTEGPSVDTATATYEITNEAPVATVEMSGPVVAGTPTTVKVGAEDPSPTDMAAEFLYLIDWEGDGVLDDEVPGPADPPVTHTYASPGDVAFTVIAVDQDEAASDATVVEFTVAPADTDDDGDGTDGDTDGGEDEGMADTGADIATPALAALGFLLVGTVLVAVARPRRR